jgi:hypothetical protein
LDPWFLLFKSMAEANKPCIIRKDKKNEAAVREFPAAREGAPPHIAERKLVLWVC